MKNLIQTISKNTLLDKTPAVFLLEDHIDENNLTFIGDIHGNEEAVERARESYPDSLLVQVGDYWTPYPEEHDILIVGGNHDIYDTFPSSIDKSPAYLGDFGTLPGRDDVFFVRGAYSVDKTVRLCRNLYWSELEELPYKSLMAASEAYKETAPRIMVTHCAPDRVKEIVFQNEAHVMSSRTESALDIFLDIHHPEIWVFGHYHKSMTLKLGRTTFISLGIDEVLNLNQFLTGQSG